ncbi:uracil-DNA glycosylase family protein [Hydrogenimonas sp.]
MFDVHPEWQEDIAASYAALDPEYRAFVERGDFIPARPKLFNAFKTLPRSRLRSILFGQDPYPRAESATGHAFIDGAVEKIFSPTGLDRAVNRATSLRNFVKMALVAEGRLDASDLTQEAIARMDRSGLIDSIDELRCNFEAEGVLLLNTALLFENKRASSRHARAWRPFVATLLERIGDDVELILFGSIAGTILKIPHASKKRSVTLEHPYNHTFVLNPQAHALFGPMHLLNRR